MAEVELEWQAATCAVSRLRLDMQDHSEVLHDARITPADVRRCEQNLDDTYFVRLFAVFEDHLRDIWEKALGRDTTPGMHDLLNALASKRRVKDADLEAAHLVREYRNRIVHGGDAEVVALPLARRYLCIFFGYMLPQW